jgi:hypothetical protein
VRVNFPGAILILDFYHALQHVHGLIEALCGKDTTEGQKRIKLWKGWLLKGKAAEMVQQAKVQLERSLDREKAGKEIGYLENNLARMTYGTFRKAGYFIGSGAVKAGCKTVIGQRMKCSGMFWSEEGGQGMLDLRCSFLSNRLDAFCQARATDHAARNDLLKFAARNQCALSFYHNFVLHRMTYVVFHSIRIRASIFVKSILPCQAP